MNIIILGAGQVGSTLSENLSAEHDITIVDQDAERLMSLQSRLDIRTLQGTVTFPAVLEAAGADDADMLIAVTDSDDSNIAACQIAYSLFKTPTKIARVRHGELNQYPKLFEPGNLAIDTIINPAHLVTERIYRQVQHPGTLMVLDFAEGALQIASVGATPPSSLIHKRLVELYHDIAEADARAQIIAIQRDNQLLFPSEDMVVEAHDEILFIAPAADTQKVTNHLLNHDTKYRRIILAGAGNIGIGLAKMLESDYHVKLIDPSSKQCEHAAGILNSAIILHGDATDTDLLTSENIEETDLFCSITNDDEANIMSAILAKRLGVKNTIALVNKQTYAHYLIERSPDVNLAVSPQRITGGAILKHLRKGDMVNVYAMSRSLAECVELVVHGDETCSAVIGKTLHELKLPEEALVCALWRDKKVYFSVNDLALASGDHLIILVKDKRSIAQVERLFQVKPHFL